MSVRKCNECTLCCRLLPVLEVQKPANTTCRHQCSKGCRVYRTDKWPLSCGLWSCRWLTDESLPLQRPDRTHYVIDPIPDFIEINGAPVGVVQIWVDPRFPKAHQDPQLREWLVSRFRDFKNQQLALIRFDSYKAIVLFPPESNSSGEWVEMPAQSAQREHTPEEVLLRLDEAKYGA